MIRVKQFRPNRKSRYGRVKVSQWSEKPTDAGIYSALDIMDYRGRFALKEEITELSISTYRGKLGAIFLRCSNPKYDWDRGYTSFMVHSSMPFRKSLKYSYEEEKEIEHEELVKFLIGAKKYFEENNLTVKITDDDMNETSIEEILSSY